MLASHNAYKSVFWFAVNMFASENVEIQQIFPRHICKSRCYPSIKGFWDTSAASSRCYPL